MASEMDDPFTTPNRNTNFDPEMMLSLPSSSPSQLKRTLEAHLQEVNKRIENAGVLGQKLLAQQQEIEANIKELEEGGDTVDPELKKKLVDLEKEYNEVGREAARAVLTNKIMTSGTSPYGAGNLSGGTGGSPSTIQAQGTNSPTKLSVPSRHQRNRPSRQHDLEFAAELGQGLLVEVRRLQALLAEREETLKIIQIDKARLEQQAEGLEVRLRALDESEQKYKEENWNLELQNQELVGRIKDHEYDNDKLQALIQHEASDKDLLLKDLDELKNQNEKLYEDLEAEHKHHEFELAATRRNLASNETDRQALEKKVEELKVELEESHNQSIRLRSALENKSENQDNENLFNMQPAQTTPEHSPPPSPTKPTPRHTHLESETLRSSLQHAHRMIANLKSNVHREKTEKSELRRLLQEARDELETARLRRDSLGGPPSSADKRRKGKPTFMKGGRPPIFKTTLLGGVRHSRDEVTMINDRPVDEEWEEAPEDEPSPTRRTFPVLTEYKLSAPETDPEDAAFESAFETANEAAGDKDTTDAFETANEQDGTATETEAYRTGNESPTNDYPTSADDMTETEGGTLLKVIQKKSSRASSFGRQVRPFKMRHRDSVASTASTEDESDGNYRYGYDMDGDEMARESRHDRHDAFMTPIAVSNQRLKLKINRARSRGSRMTSQGSFSSRDRPFSAGSSPGGGSGQRSSSPASLNQKLHTPGERKSLFAELEGGVLDLDGGEGEDDEGEGETEEEEEMPTTPTKSIMPLLPFMPVKAGMVDSGVMTDEIIEHPELERTRSFLGVGALGRPGTSHSAFSAATIEERTSTTDVGTQSEREIKPEFIENGTQFDPALEAVSTPMAGVEEEHEPKKKGRGVLPIPLPIPIPIPFGRSSAPDLSKELRLAEESRKVAEEAARQAEVDRRAAATTALVAEESRKAAEAAATKSALDLATASQELIALKPAIATLEVEIQSLKDERAALQEKAGAQVEELDTLKPKLIVLEKEIEALTVERTNLQEKVGAHEEKVVVLEPRVIALEKEIENLTTERATLQEKAGAHEEEVTVLKPQIAALEKELVDLKEERAILAEKAVAHDELIVVKPRIAVLEKEVENLAIERAALQEKAGAHEEEVVVVLKPKIVALEQEILSLKDERAALQEKTGSQEKEVDVVLKPRIAVLEQEIGALVIERASLWEKTEAQEKEVGDVLRPKIAVLEKEIEALVAERASLRQKTEAQEKEADVVLKPKIIALEEQIEALAVERANLQEKAEAQEKEADVVLKPKIVVLEKQIENLAIEHVNLQEKAEAREKEVDVVLKPKIIVLEKQIENLAIEHADLQEKAGAHEKEVTVLQPKVIALGNEVDVLKPKIVGLEKEIEVLTIERASLQEKTSAQETKETTVLQPRIAALEQDIEALTVERTSLQEKAGAQERREITVLQPKILALEKEILDLKEERAVLQVLAGAHEEVDVLKPRIVVLEEEVESLKAVRDGLQEKVRAHEEEAVVVLKPRIVVLEKELEGLRVERDGLHEKAGAHEEEIVVILRPKVAVLEKEIQDLTGDRAILQEKTASHEGELAVLKPKVAALEEEVESLRVERDGLHEKAGAHEEVIVVLKPRVVALVEEVEGLKVERCALQAKVGAQEEEVLTLKPRIVALEKTIETLTAERAMLQEKAGAHEEEVNVLKPRIVALESDIGNLENERTVLAEKAVAYDELIVVKPRIAALETEVKNLKDERAILAEKAVAHDELIVVKPKIAALEAEIENLKDERAILAEKAVAYDELIVVKPRITTLETEIENLKDERAILAEKAVAHDELIVVKPKIAALEAEIENLKNERVILAEKAVAHDELAVVKPKMVVLEKELEDLTAERAGLREKAEAHGEEINVLKPRIAALEREILGLKDECMVLQDALSAVPVRQEMKDTAVQFDPDFEKVEKEYTLVMDKVAEFEPSAPEFEVPLEFSKIQALATVPIEPETPRALPIPVPVVIPPSPVMDASVSDDETPKKVSETVEDARQRPTTPSPEKPATGFFGSMFGWKRPGSPAREPERLNSASERTFSNGTFGEVAKSQRVPPNVEGNEVVKAAEPVPVSDQEAQTDITYEFFENISTAKTIDKGKKPAFAVVAPEPMFIGDRSSTKSPSLRSRTSHDSFGLNKTRGEPSVVGGVIRRPGSATSLREYRAAHPPLPSDHKEHIAAAQQKIVAPVPTEIGAMGPPPIPSSSNLLQKNNVTFRPKTPVNDTIKPIGPETPGSKAGTTPRPKFSNSRSEVSSPTSRRSSLSSFASELDSRFNIAPEAVAGELQTDPRMIQAITQTMIGEYLWKYTRSTGRGTLSSSRHKRFFWVHPYTRTLYWSDRDPTTAGRAELRAKSVAIEAVRVVTDDNPMPPGLHRKSLVIITPGRSLKFTAPTGQRHETWFNALSYLLLRTGGELGEEENALNAEDVRDFNPNYNNNNGVAGSIRGAESLSSYNTRTTRASSPARNVSSLSNKRPSEKVIRQGSMSRLSNLFRPSSGFGTFSTRSSRNNASIYDQSELNDSAEDIREQIEQEDGELLENVRACCDGKHDVSTLPRRGGRKSTQSARGRDHHHTHASHERNNSHS